MLADGIKDFNSKAGTGDGDKNISLIFSNHQSEIAPGSCAVQHIQPAT
jgi:hypothetical protein